MGKDVKVT